MNMNDINSLADDPGNVPWSVKGVALACVMGVILFLGYKLVIVDAMAEVETAERKEQELRQTFETRQKRASQLPQYQTQLEEMQRSFGVLMRQLPSDTEIPGLILDISEKGLSNGLELELFEPGGEILMDFYAEKPIKIIAKGSYHELASFVSDISGLPRIVTIHNIDLTPEKDSKRLRMEASVKTYRYLDESDKDAEAGSTDKDAPAKKAADGNKSAAGGKAG
ncbi:MAG TPA: type 4a pilus biogenesis protein PilO [Candidatus Thiothrix moscowensis]|uniref:type 4a pilus biogenesis protein PilO n=1 Tax=unclassified Thiothrix TaxID=2636184 RepID=UPI0025F21085|nr:MULTISPECIES: type 4a pilus biogenesis protein PilO [unclassified Thiothrix]HRJ51724.1 type 4a pilus biogenesis protein PilO [Candidatus Thiothrix moscowensis]HRJ92039.1 type 4a pilus biogenesis protein PilO [Candidatus Thiothrix moscowensis]